MHQRRRSLPMSSWRQHSSQHHKIVLHLVYLGVLSQSEGFGRHGAGEGRWGREWCSFGHGTWFLNGLSLSMSLCHMVRRKSCKVLKVWPKTRLYCKICIDLQDALHSEICLHWREGNGGSTPSSVAQSCGTFRQGGARRGCWRSMKVSATPLVHFQVGPSQRWFMSIYVDYMSLDSVLKFQLLS